MKDPRASTAQTTKTSKTAQSTSTPQTARAELDGLVHGVLADLQRRQRAATRQRRFLRLWYGVGGILYVLVLLVLFPPLFVAFSDGAATGTVFITTTFYHWYEIVAGIVSLLAILHVVGTLWLRSRRRVAP